MKTIAVIGCSNSTGEETRDWELDPEYYTKSDIDQPEWYTKYRLPAIQKFFESHQELLLPEDPYGKLEPQQWKALIEDQERINGSNRFITDLSWNYYNDKFAWPALLDRHEDYKVYSFATRGAGLSHFELVYNAERSVREYDFKNQEHNTCLTLQEPL